MGTRPHVPRGFACVQQGTVEVGREQACGGQVSRRAAEKCRPGSLPRQGGGAGRSLPAAPLPAFLLLRRWPVRERPHRPCPVSAPGSLAAPTLLSFLH